MRSMSAAPSRGNISRRRLSGSLGASSITTLSALLVRVEDVVLGLDRDVARVSAVRGARVGDEPVGCRLVVEERVSPAAALGKALAVLLDHERLREDVGDVDGERRFGALLGFPLQLGDLGPFGKRLAVAGDSCLCLLY